MEHNELYLKHRPKTFKDMVGQRAAVEALVSLGKSGKIPHAILLSGGSGTGKTSAARILRNKLGCSDFDFQEINTAQNRGIDDIRRIQSECGAAPMNGLCRVYLFDEAHQFSVDASTAFLKLLEDTPDHVYFILATTDPQKLKRTIRTRCTEIKFQSIPDQELKKLAAQVADEEGIQLEPPVIQKLVETAEGSARQLLVNLHAISEIPDPKDQEDYLIKNDSSAQAIEIARKLLNNKTTWKTMATLLKDVKEEPETIRALVLSYCTTALLGGNSRAAFVIESFQYNFFDSKRAGLVLACYNVISGGR